MPGDALSFVVSYMVQDELFGGARTGLRTNEDGPAKRDTKWKGDVSELRVAATLTEAGYAVSKPLGENQRYDLIIDDGERLQRVQVKTGRVRGDAIMFNCSSTHAHRRSSATTRPYTGEIELLAVFCAENGKVYLIPEADLTRSKIQLRLSAPRNNMTKTIRWAARYELA